MIGCQNIWVNYNSQFTYALEHFNIQTPWILRIDANEYFGEYLLIYLEKILTQVKEDINVYSLILKCKF